jgi:phosphomannomutase
MVLEIGDRDFDDVMKVLCSLQAEIVNEGYEFPLTGDFIQNRGSTINWCPLGRTSDSLDRDAFVKVDVEHNVRGKYIEKMRKMSFDAGVNVVSKLSGDTSFDIYPRGWDKTYIFNHFDSKTWDVWFVGDRCGENGNDYEIFNHLSAEGRAFETSGPTETMEIIDYYILKELMKKDV